jgi:hypothetical protein
MLRDKVKPMCGGPPRCGKLVFVVNVLVNVTTSSMHTSREQHAHDHLKVFSCNPQNVFHAMCAHTLAAYTYTEDKGMQVKPKEL